jgi:hypothetical protein
LSAVFIGGFAQCALQKAIHSSQISVDFDSDSFILLKVLLQYLAGDIPLFKFYKLVPVASAITKSGNTVQEPTDCSCSQQRVSKNNGHKRALALNSSLI